MVDEHAFTFHIDFAEFSRNARAIVSDRSADGDRQLDGEELAREMFTMFRDESAHAFAGDDSNANAVAVLEAGLLAHRLETAQELTQETEIA